MRLPRYEEIAKTLLIPRCPGCDGFDHKRGQLDMIAEQVHWADRERVERAGIRRFLKLGADLKLRQSRVYSTWQRLYLSQGLMNDWAATLGVRLPPAGRHADQLTLRAMLINVPTDEPMREEAMAWALGK